MDVVVAAVGGDRRLDPLLVALRRVATDAPTVVGSRSDVELALRSRSRDLLVFDPDVLSLAGAAALQIEGLPRLVGWLPTRSPGRTAEMLDGGVEEVLDSSMTSVELGARLRRVARSSGTGMGAARPVSFGEMSVDARDRRASWRGQPLGLTAREIEVLQVLVAGGGLTIRREVIYRQVWRWAMPRGDRTVDVNVKRIRDKLAAAGVPVRVVSDPGVGYRLVSMATSEVVTGL